MPLRLLRGLSSRNYFVNNDDIFMALRYSWSMTTGVNPLKPVQMRDKNGHMVTRWMRVLEETGEPAIVVPAPAIPSAPQVIESVLWRLFPEFDEESGKMIDIFSQDWEYTDVFTRHALSMLPAKTMKWLHDDFNDDSSITQCHLALVTYRYLMAMHEYGREDNAGEQYEAAVRHLNNTLLLREAMQDLADVTGELKTAEDMDCLLNWSLECLERPDLDPRGVGGMNQSSIDYAQDSKREPDDVVAYVIALRLTEFFTPGLERNDGATPEFIEFVRSHHDNRSQIMDMVRERRTTDVAVLQSMLETESPAMSSGAL